MNVERATGAVLLAAVLAFVGFFPYLVRQQRTTPY